MKYIFTQIYSLQVVDEALACARAGADRIGVLVGQIDGPYPCAVSEEKAKEIFDAIGGKAIRVLISVEKDPLKIIEQCERLKPEVLHLCAEYEGNKEFADELKKHLPNIKLMEAVGVGDDYSAIEDAKKKASYADILILDSVSKTIPGVGAAGIVHDWAIDAEIRKVVDCEIIEAGGLGVDNVLEAIEAVKPDGVDSLTKTSIKENGKLIRKDIELVKKFCELVHSVK